MPNHVHMRYPGFQEFLTDQAKPQALIERCGLYLCTQHLLLQPALLGLADHRLHQRIADFQAAPVLEYRNPANVTIGQQAGGANRKVAFESEEMHRCGVIGIPFQLRRNGLLGDEHRLTNAPYLGDILLPVCDTNVDFIHQQTPGCLA